MGLIKLNTQRGNENNIYECVCGSHMIRIVKGTPFKDWPIQHSIEFWEYRGASSWNFLDRLKLAFRILIGKEAKWATYEIIVTPEDVQPLADAIKNLND